MILRSAKNGHRGDLSPEVGLTERLVLLGKTCISTNQACYAFRALYQRLVTYTFAATKCFTLTGGEKQASRRYLAA